MEIYSFWIFLVSTIIIGNFETKAFHRNTPPNMIVGFILGVISAPFVFHEGMKFIIVCSILTFFLLLIFRKNEVKELLSRENNRDIYNFNLCVLF